MKQKAVHIITKEYQWRETWSKDGKPAEVICGVIKFLCGHQWDWVRFPGDKPISQANDRPGLPICKRCLKKKDQVARGSDE